MQSSKSIPNFMGVPFAKFEDARIIILPVPYEGTVTYGSGTQNGPKAIIEASKHVEFYDDELDCEPYVWGIHTLPELELNGDDPDKVFESIADRCSELIVEDKLIIMLGGEHSISPAMVSALSARKYKELSVLQLDAHADLRDEYEGTKYNHACAMRRILEYCPITQVGIRSLSLLEKSFIDSEQLDVFFMRDIRSRPDWIYSAIDCLSRNVYVTIDLDVFDPSIMPSVGTPEPGGMLWEEAVALFKILPERRNIIGFDMVELSPQPGNVAPDFLAAKLAYKLIGYTLQAFGKSLAGEKMNKPNITDDNKNNFYAAQITDIVAKRKCTIKIDPVSSFRELMEKYVKVIRRDIMTDESVKNLNTIQDCIYKISDRGELTDLYNGLIVKQEGDIVDLDDEPTYRLVQSGDESIMLLDLTIDRSQITEEGNSYGYNIRKWGKNRQVFESFVRECLKANGSEADRIMSLATTEDKKKFLMSIGKKIWESDFELYSRFIGDRLWFKDPAETLHNIVAGRGGTCAEKSSAMKLITDAYGISSEYLLSGPGAKGPFPADVLRNMLKTLDFELGKKYMIYWQHVALLYNVDGEDILIDVSNGNIPFLFLTGSEVDDLLRPKNKKGIKVRMVMEEEDFYYHLPPQDIPESLLVAMQEWIEDIDLIHVLDDGLGLLITKDYYVWPVMYRDDDEKLTEYDWWINQKNKLRDVELLDNFSLPGKVANEFKEKYPQKFVDIVEAADYLGDRFNDSYRKSPDDPRYNVAFIFVSLGMVHN